MIYYTMSLMEDVETQKRGVVALMYYIGKFESEYDGELMTRLKKLLEWLPMRYSAMHLCHNHPMVRALSPVIKLQFARNRRVRFRIHDGELLIRGYYDTLLHGILHVSSNFL
jgi:hypothetical protein